MNIHPILVHFPIALLSVYSIAELIRFRFILSTSYWFYIKAFLVITGTAGAAVAYISGEAAEDLLGGGDLGQLIETHSLWAKGTSIMFGLISVFYIIVWISRLPVISRIEEAFGFRNFGAYFKLKNFVNYLVVSPVMIFFAVAGLIGITVTGALGGSIVYGPDVDPFVRIIYNLVFKG